MKNGIQKYVASTEGRYLELGEFKSNYEDNELAGIVLHDEAGVFDKAIYAGFRKNFGLSLKRLRIGKRFQARVVLKDARCVLLIGTGMGCTGSSIVVHELGFQEIHVPILKIGTCVSTWRSAEVGTILVPRWAIAAEGVTDWEKPTLPCPISEIFVNRDVVGMNRDLKKKWIEHIKKCNWKRFHGAFFDCETAVWSADAFYALLEFSDLFQKLAKEYVITLANPRKPRTKVLKIMQKRQRANSSQSKPLVGWDMECSAIFSAAQKQNLQIVATLVVSWSSEHWIQLAKTGKHTRKQNVRENAHKIERALIRQGIRYLLQRPLLGVCPSNSL